LETTKPPSLGSRGGDSDKRPVADRILLGLFERFPPRSSIFKEAEGRPQSEYDAEADRAFPLWFGLTPEAMFASRDVLDLGCGFGGRSVRFREQGARSVLGVEVTDEKVQLASKFVEDHGAAGVTFRRTAGARDIPADDNSFDLITMYDVLEHVVDARATLEECRRVLRPGGLLATVFPPYYSARSGSHLHGYATRLPGLNLIFPSRTLRRATATHLDTLGVDWRSYLRDEPSDRLWNMNGITIRHFNRLIDELGFVRRSIRYFGDLDHRVPGGYGKGRLGRLRKPPVSTVLTLPARLPMVREAACSRVVALLER
jgi:SAM-dependent methyltransferase